MASSSLRDEMILSKIIQDEHVPKDIIPQVDSLGSRNQNDLASVGLREEWIQSKIPQVRNVPSDLQQKTTSCNPQQQESESALSFPVSAQENSGNGGISLQQELIISKLIQTCQVPNDLLRYEPDGKSNPLRMIHPDANSDDDGDDEDNNNNIQDRTSR